MENSNFKKHISKLINKETLLYIVFGVLTTLVNFGVYTVCQFIFKDFNLESNNFLNFVYIGKPYLLSNNIAWIIAVIFAFFTNKFIVFKSYNKKASVMIFEFIKFVGARLTSFLIEQLGLYILVDMLLQNDFVAKVIISILVIILNYFFSKLLVFKKSK